MAAEVAHPQIGDSALLQRLQSYSLVSSAVGFYQNIKNSSSLATRGLDICESVAKSGIQVSIPVIKKVDEYTHIDERSVAFLDVIETRAGQAKDGISKVNTIAHQPLDTLIDVLDTYLPLPEQHENEGSMDPSTSVAGPQPNAKALSSFGKIGAIGTHLGQASVVKLRELQLRGPIHKVVAGQMWELVSSTAHTVEVAYQERAPQYVHAVQDTLFAQAANVQAFIEKRPMLLAMEKAVEPYVSKTSSAAAQIAIRVISNIQAATILSAHFFSNRAADLSQIAHDAARIASEKVDEFAKTHPDWEKRANDLLATLRATFQRASATIREIAALPLDQLSLAVGKIFGILQKLQVGINKFSSHMVAAAQQDKAKADTVLGLSEPSGPGEEQEEHGQQHGQHPHGQGKKRGKKH